MNRFPYLAEALAFILSVWIVGQAGVAPRTRDEIDPTVDLDLYCSIFGIEP